MADDLAAFIAARLDEDEAAAREAAGLTGNWIAEEPAIGIVLVDGEPLIEGHITGLTAHIARHDPARVLREVSAKRAILAWWLSDENEPESALSPGLRAEYREAQPGYELILRIAAIWSDHPDYRPEWKP